MTGYTPRLGLPYPEQSTMITDSAAVMQELAEKLENAIPEILTVEPEPSAKANQVAAHLIADITASGNYTVPDLVGDGSPTLWDIVMISGGYTATVSDVAGSGGYPSNGGNGGHCRVWRGIKLAPGGVFPVTIGGQKTGCGFGPLTIPAESGPSQPEPYGAGGAGGDITDGLPGEEGCTITPINGATTYWCGGGGSGGRGSYNSTNFPGGSGGNRGGGKGGIGGSVGNWTGATEGEKGTYGGGGGSGGGAVTGNQADGAGSPGRVMLFAPIAGVSTRRRSLPTPVEMFAALDAAGSVLMIVAADPDNPYVPGIEYDRLVPFPNAPVDTGRTITVPADPDDPDGPTVEQPVMAWPEAGWTWNETDGWKEPA